MVTTEQDKGFIESSQQLLSRDGREWTPIELRGAAERGELRNTGWPIGLVLDRDGDQPIPSTEGIEARIGHYREDWQDYWKFRKDGSYYVIRIFEEETETLGWSCSEGHPERMLWFDVRIWRIAEVILHSAAIYKELAIPTDEPYMLAVNHGGLSEREFYVAEGSRHVRRGSISHTWGASWTKEVTQDYVITNLPALVRDVGSNLFALFDFQKIEDRIIDGITNKFLGSRR